VLFSSFLHQKTEIYEFIPTFHDHSSLILGQFALFVDLFRNTEYQDGGVASFDVIQVITIANGIIL